MGPDKAQALSERRRRNCGGNGPAQGDRGLMSGEYTHRPVLLEECIQALHIQPEGIYVDGTLGRGGHAMEIARRLTTGRLLCIDRDRQALEEGSVRLAWRGSRQSSWRW